VVGSRLSTQRRALNGTSRSLRAGTVDELRYLVKLACVPTSKFVMYHCGYTSYAIEQANTIRVSMAELTRGLSRRDDSMN
jgi:hypothetical protein